jgi:hypothetical protein
MSLRSSARRCRRAVVRSIEGVMPVMTLSLMLVYCSLFLMKRPMPSWLQCAGAVDLAMTYFVHRLALVGEEDI